MASVRVVRLGFATVLAVVGVLLVVLATWMFIVYSGNPAGDPDSTTLFNAGWAFAIAAIASFAIAGLLALLPRLRAESRLDSDGLEAFAEWSDQPKAR
jgi:hypothetical protein